MRLQRKMTIAPRSHTTTQNSTTIHTARLIRPAAVRWLPHVCVSVCFICTQCVSTPHTHTTRSPAFIHAVRINVYRCQPKCIQTAMVSPYAFNRTQSSTPIWSGERTERPFRTHILYNRVCSAQTDRRLPELAPAPVIPICSTVLCERGRANQCMQSVEEVCCWFVNLRVRRYHTR